jgi:hypothetical protein
VLSSPAMSHSSDLTSEAIRGSQHGFTIGHRFVWAQTVQHEGYRNSERTRGSFMSTAADAGF